jgi:hypothetical protein
MQIEETGSFVDVHIFRKEFVSCQIASMNLVEEVGKIIKTHAENTISGDSFLEEYSFLFVVDNIIPKISISEIASSLPVNFSPWVSKFHNFDVPSIIGCDL